MKSATKTTEAEVGIRDLRDHLSQYLAQVRSGIEIVVTDHSRPIARILPPSASTNRLAALIAAGAVTAPTAAKALPPRANGLPPLSDLVDDQRR